MLSIQEIKLMIEKLERLEKQDWKNFISTFKSNLQELALSLDAYNEHQNPQLDKTKNWYAEDLDWRENRRLELHDPLLMENIKNKISNFAKMGNNLQNCLEIGPGYGKFVECLLSWRLIFFVDLFPFLFPKIKKKINPKHHHLLRFYTTERTECPQIPSNSCNFIFSWDTFTFFTQQHIGQYLKDLFRVLIPGGYGFIHYADCNFDADLDEAKRGYWNFNTKESMKKLCLEAGYEIIEQDQFKPKANYVVFKKPGNKNPSVYKMKEIPIGK